MKRIIIIFGTIGGVIISGLMIATISMTKDFMNMEYGEVLGYLSMVIALSTVFFGIKSFRDNESGGSLTFGKGLLVGLAISLIAGLFYVVTWEFFYHYQFSDFADLYLQQSADHLREAGKTETEIEKELADTRTMMELYKNNTLVRMGMTLAEILPVGIVISLISAAILKRRDVLPA